MHLSRTKALLLVGMLLGAATSPFIVSALAPYLSNSGPVSGGGTFAAPSGPSINLTGSVTANLSDAPESGVLELRTSKGNVTFRSSSTVSGHIDAANINGTWTTVDQLSVATTDLYINPEDKPAVNVSGDLNRIEFTTPQADDGNADFIYAGTSGTTSVTVRTLPANTPVRAVNISDGQVLDIGTTDSSGTVTFEGMPNSEHQVSIQTADAPPELSNPRPNTNLSTAPSQFTVHVEDDDFPGDTVNLTWYKEGTQFATSTGITSSGDVSVSAPSLGPGLTDWSVVATDENGNTDVINATVGQPGFIFIRNETNGDMIVDTVNVTVRFDNGTIVTNRTVSDGTLDMTGLPTHEFVVILDPQSNFYGRTVYFPNVIGNRSVYLLNKNFTANEVRFVLNDPTGQFSSESLLYVKRAINVSGTNRYRTIHSDYFGAEGVTTELQNDTRYQIYVRNEEGEMQRIGPYRSDVSETVEVQPGTPSVDLGNFSQGWAYNASLTNRTLEVRYSDPEQETQQLTIYIYEKGNKTNRLRPNDTFYALGNLSTVYTLTKNESQKTWVVIYDVERDNESYVLRETVQNNPDVTLPDLDREWRLIAGMAMLFIFAGAFSVLNVAVGAIMISIAGGLLWFTGWLTGATTGIAIVLYMFLAIVYSIYKSGP